MFQVITAMESAEKEIVEFVREIVPADAQGLVEKWLLQVRLIATGVLLCYI